MKLSRRELGIGVGTAALAAAYGRPGWAQAPIVIKYSHVVANDTPAGTWNTPSSVHCPVMLLSMNVWR